jgi:uncharacterized protein (TIGR00251 family)
MFFEKENRIFFYVKIVANAGTYRVLPGLTVAYDKPTLKMQVKAARESGKANQELIGYLSNIFEVPKSHVVIESGEFQPFKRVMILNMKMQKAQEVFMKQGFLWARF